MSKLDELYGSIVNGESDKAVELTHQLLADQIPAKEILDNGLLPAIDEIGNLFEKSEIFLPELLMAGVAMKASIKLLGLNYRKKVLLMLGRV